MVKQTGMVEFESGAGLAWITKLVPVVWVLAVITNILGVGSHVNPTAMLLPLRLASSCKATALFPKSDCPPPPPSTDGVGIVTVLTPAGINAALCNMIPEGIVCPQVPIENQFVSSSL